MRHRSRYYIYRVTKADTSSPAVHRYQDPARLIAEDRADIRLSNATMRLGAPRCATRGTRLFRDIVMPGVAVELISSESQRPQIAGFDSPRDHIWITSLQAHVALTVSQFSVELTFSDFDRTKVVVLGFESGRVARVRSFGG